MSVILYRASVSARSNCNWPHVKATKVGFAYSCRFIHVPGIFCCEMAVCSKFHGDYM